MIPHSAHLRAINSELIISTLQSLEVDWGDFNLKFRSSKKESLLGEGTGIDSSSYIKASKIG